MNSAARLGLLVGALLVISACNTKTVRTIDISPHPQVPAAVPEALLLDVGITVFAANVPDDYDEQVKAHISPEVRRAEGNYIAYILKNMLQSTGNWGAVRVVPRPTNAVDVIVSGTILRSDGATLQLEAKVMDSSGTQWFT